MSEDLGVQDRIKALAWERCIPVSPILELTRACNLRCAHCYNFDRDERWSPDGAELSFEEIAGVVRQLREAGAMALTITGGEPMVHPRFFDLLDLARELHLVVKLLSNGTRLSEDACDLLAAYRNVQGVDVSLYGARAPTHDGITRSPGSFDGTWAGIRRLRERGVPVRAKIILMRSNAGEAAEMLEQVARAAVPAVPDPCVTSRFDGSVTSLRERVTPEQMESLYRGPLRSWLVQEGFGRAPQPLLCHCTRGRVAVSSTGEVWPCIAVPIPCGNVRERPFAEIWRDSPVLGRIRRLQESDFAACAPCSLRPWCRREAGGAYLASGEYTGYDPWSCREAEAIRGALGEER